MLVGTRTLFRIIDSSANHFSCSHSCILKYFGDYRGTVPDAGKGRPFDIEDHAKVWSLCNVKTIENFFTKCLRIHSTFQTVRIQIFLLLLFTKHSVSTFPGFKYLSALSKSFLYKEGFFHK